MVEGQEKMDRNRNKERCVQEDTRKNFFTLRTVKHKKTVHSEDVLPLCLDLYRICQDWSNTI